VTPARIAVLCDYPEEGWTSMNYCAEMLLAHLGPESGGRLVPERVVPAYRRRLGRVPAVGRRRVAVNADRLFNRHWDYPRYLRRRAGEFDLYHVVDHSYAQLVNAVPAYRAGVYCHDLDAFRCLLEPQSCPRPRWFRAMMRRVLNGFQRAAIVFYTTDAVRREIVAHGLVDPARLVHAPNGVGLEFSPEPGSDDGDIAELNGPPFLLHVGSCVPRKRIDILLDVFAAVRKRHENLRLVQLGGEWKPEHVAQIDRLGLRPHLFQTRGVSRSFLAAAYRRAALVVQPSEAEGFGLPVIEALACGTAVVASDIPPLREIGGAAVVFCPVADIAAWADTVDAMLCRPADAEARSARLARAAPFTWSVQARTIAEAYLRLLDTRSRTPQ
jgi:glycosyltransferase involved in cell wall biosynthesis